MQLIILVPREDYIEAIEINDEKVSIRKLPSSHDLNQLKYPRQVIQVI